MLYVDLTYANIKYFATYLSSKQADYYFELLRKSIPWQQHQITIFGKTHDTPRLSYWVADAGLDYGYSNMTMCANPWSDLLLEIKKEISQTVDHDFNSVLLNYYRDGQDSNGWHSDDEPELGENPVIASLSLGAPRDFQLRNKFNKQEKHTINLAHGSLLLMEGGTQHAWQHQLPKRVNTQARINLTFRTIV